MDSPVIHTTCGTPETEIEGLSTLVVEENHPHFIRRFPPEIIAEIFLHCIPPFLRYKKESYNTTFPLILGAICKHWREIAWTTPRLWTSITVNLQTHSVPLILDRLLLFTEWCSRSRSLPISIRVLGQGYSRDWRESTSELVMESITRYAAQWKAVDLRLSTTCLSYFSSNIRNLNSSSPHLQFLSLKQGPAETQAWKLDLTEIAPKLEELTLTRIDLSAVQVRWDILTRLEMRQSFLGEAYEALSHAINLVHCVMRSLYAGDGYEVTPNPTLLSQLETLDWVYGLASLIKPVLDKLVMPSLTHCRLEPGDWDTPSPSCVQQFINLLVSPPLTTLILRGVVLDEDILINIWVSSPILTVINLVPEPTIVKDRPPLTREITKFYVHPAASQWNEVNYLLPALRP